MLWPRVWIVAGVAYCNRGNMARGNMASRRAESRMGKESFIRVFNVYLKQNKNKNQNQTLELSIVFSIGHKYVYSNDWPCVFKLDFCELVSLSLSGLSFLTSEDFRSVKKTNKINNKLLPDGSNFLQICLIKQFKHCLIKQIWCCMRSVKQNGSNKFDRLGPA